LLYALASYLARLAAFWRLRSALSAAMYTTSEHSIPYNV
jgi:hypothetical protein